MRNMESVSMSIVHGALVGDAYGAQLELLKPRPIPQELMDLAETMELDGLLSLARGQITDDGELTICLLRFLVLQQDAAQLYREWYKSNPVDCGISCKTAFSGAYAGTTESDTAKYNADSQANGALMRVSPIGAVGPLRGWCLEQVADAARADALLSHPNVICQEANVAYAVTLASLVEDGRIDEAISQGLVYCNSPVVCEWIATSINAPEIVVAEMKNDNIGWVRWGFMLAYYHLRARHSYEVAIRETCRLGGDTDTNACIVGGMIGAVSTIPEKWLGPVLACDVRPAWLRPSCVTTLFQYIHAHASTRLKSSWLAYRV